MNKSDIITVSLVLFAILVKALGYIRTDIIYLDYYTSGITKSIGLAVVMTALTFNVREHFIYKLALGYTYVQYACCMVYIGVYSGYNWAYSLSYFLILSLAIILVICRKNVKDFFKGWEDSFKQKCK